MLVVNHTEEQKKAIAGCIREISDSMTRKQAESDLQKEILNRMKEEFEIPKATARSLAKTYYKNNIQEVVAKNEELEELYNQLFTPKP